MLICAECGGKCADGTHTQTEGFVGLFALHFDAAIGSQRNASVDFGVHGENVRRGHMSMGGCAGANEEVVMGYLRLARPTMNNCGAPESALVPEDNCCTHTERRCMKRRAEFSHSQIVAADGECQAVQQTPLDSLPGELKTARDLVREAKRIFSAISQKPFLRL